MKFGPVPVAEAEGAILAHSIGTPGGRLKKGRRLSAVDVSTLAEAGLTEVTVARFGPDDMPEDEAAARIAAALNQMPEDDGLSISAPFTGRANVFATRDGVLTLDAGEIDKLNAIDEAITFATLPAYARVQARQMLGTVKIIPYAAPADGVRAAEAAAPRCALRVHPFRLRSARLILTRTPGMKPSLLSKGADAVRNRLAALGIEAVTEAVTDHSIDALAAEIKTASEEITLILTGSATSDRADVGPAALLSAGGDLTRFGMPVDPGNLLFLGRRGGIPVVGLPGCARSPKLNGADWVLERLVAGLEVRSEDVAAMGAGGLLKEIPSRPEPRAGGAATPQRPRVAAIVLAAGASRRMRGRDKLLEPVNGVPLLQRVAKQVMRSAVDDVLCVLPPGSDNRLRLVEQLDLPVITNARAREGMGTSIAAGIAALGPEVDAALVVLSDMPEITAEDIDRLLAAFDPGENRAIVRATAADGTPGQPVLFGRRFFEALRNLEGDQGARAVVLDHPEFTVDVALQDRRALVDLDTQDAWEAWKALQAEG